MMTDTDVIIAGAGPAGSLAAYELAILGVPVLILEKSPFPRDKVCGAGLTYKILREIPFDVSPVLETQIHNIIFSSGFREGFTRTSAEPILYCTNRDKLDDFLLKKAVKEGARVIHGAKVMEVTQEKEFVTVVTRAGTFRSKLVIGADGASSDCVTIFYRVSPGKPKSGLILQPSKPFLKQYFWIGALFRADMAGCFQREIISPLALAARQACRNG
ncbi:MAG: NAD(P)/FAD-dependent oxidoreductase [Deltaproteobacteria bacterium]|nr:NAD(P)/FAD-dependent oxidoreductase [Deltaproteobacteria bacterium]